MGSEFIAFICINTFLIILIYIFAFRKAFNFPNIVFGREKGLIL